MKVIEGGVQNRISDVITNITQVIRGKDEAIELALVALLSGGHVLVEDIPGVGKTMLSLALAKSIQCSFKRIQFTNDTIPADILGMMVFSRKEEKFRFVPGPIFAGVVVADEINRSSPKTQSALLEAMTERKVSVENHVYKLPDPFILIATQNPIEHHGTFPLPESQLDRFLIRINLGYPTLEAEREILAEDIGPERVQQLSPVISGEEVADARENVGMIRVEDSVLDYILQLIAATRRDKRLSLGVSPRGALMLKKASQAMAYIRGREYVIPDDIKSLAVPVLAHRTSLIGSGSHLESETREMEAVMLDILDSVPVPV